MLPRVTGTLLCEVQLPGESGWVTLAALTPEMPEGSITDTAQGGRDIIMFRCEGDRSVISRSADGIDFEAGQLRAVLLPIEGRETLAELSGGQVYERDVRSDQGIAYRARWTHRDAG